MIELAGVKVLVDIVEKAGSWFSEVMAKRKESKEQHAARLLMTSGILLAAMRTMDNSLRAVMREVNLFSPEWPLDRRERLVQRVNEFANDEKILPVIRQYYEQLSSVLEHEPIEDREDAEDAEQVLFCARGILWALGESVVTPFPDTQALRDFIGLVRRARTTEEVVSVLSQSDAVLAVVRRDHLALADCAFGRLKGRLLHRYSDLPDPGWSVALSGNSASGAA